MSPSATAGPAAGAFVELTSDRCWELLGSTAVGRVAWNSFDGPQVLPVTYALSAGDIVFRTSPYGPLAELSERQTVAFEIDEIDAERRTGWSVQARGPAQALTGSGRLLELFRSDAVVPWASGSRPLYVVISPVTVTGRQVRATDGPPTERTLA